MKRTPILSLLLCAALLLVLLTGCGADKSAPEPAEPDATEAPQETELPAETEAPAPTADPQAQAQAITDTLMAARETYDPDTVICTVDGYEVTWGMYYYFLAGDLEEMAYYTGALPGNFDEQVTDEVTFGAYFKDSALGRCKYYAVAQTKAAELGLGLTEEQEQQIGEYWDSMVEHYGGREALEQAMKEACLTEELFLTFLRSNDALSNVMEQTYGLAGELLTEEQVSDWAAEKGYARTKHILYYFYDDQGQPLDDAGKAALKQKADETLAELKALEDPEAREARFDEIMAADSGDPGLESFPEGYTFPANTMYEEFEAAAFALEEYALSELVESQSGYHIILRLPLLPEGRTLDQNANTGEYMTLRESAANDMFSRDLSGWIKNAEVVWTEGFEDLDLNALFTAEE